VLADLAGRPAPLHVIATGRNAPPALMDAADLVSEIKEIKHPFHQGVLAQRGIDY
jgi:cob(I)alamin adenosyltransferase